MGSRKKTFSPPPSDSGQKNYLKKILCLEIAGNGLCNFFLSTIIWTKRAIFLGKYFKKPVNDCEFSDRQLIHNTLILILIFGFVVLNKIYLIFQRLQICGQPLSWLSTKKDFFYGFLIYNVVFQGEDPFSVKNIIFMGLKLFLAVAGNANGANEKSDGPPSPTQGIIKVKNKSFLKVKKWTIMEYGIFF